MQKQNLLDWIVSLKIFFFHRFLGVGSLCRAGLVWSVPVGTARPDRVAFWSVWSGRSGSGLADRSGSAVESGRSGLPGRSGRSGLFGRGSAAVSVADVCRHYRVKRKP